MRFDGRGHAARLLATGKLRQTCSTYKKENKDEKGCKHTHNIHCDPREEKWRPTLQAIRPWTRQNPSSESRQACGTVVASAAKRQAIMFTSQVSKV